MNLRPHQTRTIAAVRAAWPSKRRVLVYAPTGAGKTVIAASLMQAERARVVFVAPWRELIGQTVTKLREMGIEAGVVMGSRRNLSERVLVCSIETVRRVENLPDCDLVVVDEAHRADTDLRRALLTKWPKARHLLLSATPWREGYGGLNDIADTMVNAANYSELVKAGYLVQPTLYTLAEPATGKAVVDAAVREWSRLASGLRTLWFTSTVAESKGLTELLTKKGVKAAHVDGSMGSIERNRIVQALRDGELQVVTNCSCLCEGFDCPPLQCVVLRPCDSLSWYVQAVGRVMRPSEGKSSAVVIDPAGVAHRFGPAWADREWSLDRPPEVEKPLDETVKVVPSALATEAAEPLPNLSLVKWDGEEGERVMRRVASATGYGPVWLARELCRLNGSAPPSLRSRCELALEGDPLKAGKLRAWFGS